MSISIDIRQDANVDIELPPATYDTAAPRRLILDEILDLYRYRHLITNMVKRNVTARYKRSALGVLWTLLDPLFTMVIMAVVFSALLARSIPGFPVFILSGLIIWNYISQATIGAMADLLHSGSLLSKVYLPKSVFAVTAAGTGLVNLIISLIPLFIFVLIFNRPITSALLFLPIALIIISLFTLGLGLFMSAFAALYADMQNVFNIFMRLVMYLSAIFYSVEHLPEQLQVFVLANPVYHMIQLFREPIYDGILPSKFSILFAVITSVVMLIIGFFVFTRLSDEYSYRV